MKLRIMARFCLVAAMALGCGSKSAAPQKAGTAAPTTPTQSSDLQLTQQAGGYILIEGKDRFGTPTHIVYENRDFLSKAIPSLRLSLSEAQIKRIDAWLAKDSTQARIQ